MGVGTGTGQAGIGYSGYIFYYSGGSEKLPQVSLALAKDTAKKLRERGKCISSVEVVSEGKSKRLSLDEFLKL